MPLEVTMLSPRAIDYLAKPPAPGMRDFPFSFWSGESKRLQNTTVAALDASKVRL